jgi:hypothetical protein
MHNSSCFLHKNATHSFTKHSAQVNGVGILDTREFDQLFMNRHLARLVRPSSLSEDKIERLPLWSNEADLDSRHQSPA